MNHPPFSSWPCFSQEEAAAVANTLLSNKVNYWTGSECKAFEEDFAKFSNCDYAISLANGTVALETGLRALQVLPGDEVIVPSKTFIATASAVVAVGAVPVFADVDRDTQNIDIGSVRSKITSRTRGIICVHHAGLPCDMPRLMALADNHDLWIVEDCAQAHGAQIDGRSVGSFGDVGAWSFCQDKIMTTGGEGGMFTTNSRDVWGRAWSYKDHGKSYEAKVRKDHPPGFRWLHYGFGSNYRMTELQAVIGRIQLTKIKDWTALRNRNAQALIQQCDQSKGFSCSPVAPNCQHAYYRFYMFTDLTQLKENWTRDRIVEHISSLGVPCYQGGCSEIYLESAFENHPSKPDTRLPNSRHLSESAIAFLVHPNMTEAEVQRTQDAIADVDAIAFQ